MLIQYLLFISQLLVHILKLVIFVLRSIGDKDENDRACSTHGEEEECMKGSGGRDRRRERPFGRPGHRWEVNIKMDLREIEPVILKCYKFTKGVLREVEIVVYQTVWVYKYVRH
jgi:hypothetical protein